MNLPAKRMSDSRGEIFLRRAFAAQQVVLETQLSLAAESITHPGKYGDVTEGLVVDMLRRYLPERYQVDSAIVIDYTGRTSEQIDVVVYDRYYTPTLLDQKGHKYVPFEAVYAVFEIKPRVDASKLSYAGRKAASVRSLKPAIAPHMTADGPKKTNAINIIAGLIAPKIGWRTGFSAPAFRKALSALTEKQRLDCVLALQAGTYDRFDPNGGETIRSKDNCLIFFLFRLLDKLRMLGNAPAVDWATYAKNFKN